MKRWKERISNFDAVVEYQKMAARKSEFERTELAKKTGVALEGFMQSIRSTGRKLPVWISDYVLMTYGTGAIMAVPAHDTRDWEFAEKFNLPIIEVVAGGEDVQAEAFTDVSEGTMVNSGFFDRDERQGCDRRDDRVPLKKRGLVSVRLIISCATGCSRASVTGASRFRSYTVTKCGWVALPESALPLELPELEDYEPTDNGESPLAKMTDWSNHDVPALSRPGEARNRHDAAVGGLVVVLPALY